jgi:hypothetical protein
MPLIPLFITGGTPAPLNLSFAFSDEDDTVACSVDVIVQATLAATDEDDSVSIALDADISAALNATDEDDTVSVLLAQEIHEQAQPAVGAPGSMWLELAYYHKRWADEESEKKRERKRIKEEAERIAAEAALSIRARHEVETKAKNRATRRAIDQERAEIEALETDIERLQAEMNRTYREEMARRRMDEEQEMADVIFMLLTEV